MKSQTTHQLQGINSLTTAALLILDEVNALLTENDAVSKDVKIKILSCRRHLSQIKKLSQDIIE